MELRHLRYFCAVAEALSFSRAAEALRVAQPALSRQIKDLEEEMGVKLFERTTARVQLTESGQYFLSQTQKLLMQLDLAVTSAQKIQRGFTDQLKIGVDWTLPNPALASAIQTFRTHHPEVAVELKEMPAHEHLAALRSHKIDLGVVPSVIIGARDDLRMEPLFTSPMNVIVASGHALAGKESVLLRELKDDSWLMLDPTRYPGFRSVLLQLLRPSLFTPHLGRAATSIAGLIGLVGTGEGVALMPSIVLPHPPSSIRVLATECAPFEVTVVWLKKNASPRLETFIALLRSEFESSAPRPKASRHKTKKRRVD